MAATKRRKNRRGIGSTPPREDTNARRESFVEAYLACWQGTEAARRAGYKSPEVAGSRLIRNDKVRARIAERLAELKAETDMVIGGLKSIATSSMGNYVRIEPVFEERTVETITTDDDGNDVVQRTVQTTDRVIDTRIRWDFLNPAADLSLVKKLTIKPGMFGETIAIELYSRMDALRTLAQIGGLLSVSKDDGEWQQYILQIGLDPQAVATLFQKVIELIALSKAGLTDDSDVQKQFMGMLQDAAHAAQKS